MKCPTWESESSQTLHGAMSLLCNGLQSLKSKP